MITQGYYTTLQRLLIADIAQIGFGTSDDPVYYTDANLTNAIIIDVSSIDARTDSSGNAVIRVYFDLTAGAAPDGFAIREIGVFASDGTLINRQIRSEVITMTDDKALAEYIDFRV